MTTTFETTDKISEKAREFREWVSNPDNFLKSCDGGDVGSPENRSIWLLGVEPGFSSFDKEQESKGNKLSSDILDEYSIDLQLKWPFNTNAFKLLAAIDGKSTSDYINFANHSRPFERGCAGYFKGNLFPEAFNKIESWDDAASLSTGFAKKSDYQAWMRNIRFPILKSWIEKCQPKLVIGTGITFLNDFLTVTGTIESPDPFKFAVNGHGKRMYLAKSGNVPVAVIPHLSGGPNGLNSYAAIEIAAKKIRDMIA